MSKAARSRKGSLAAVAALAWIAIAHAPATAQQASTPTAADYIEIQQLVNRLNFEIGRAHV